MSNNYKNIVMTNRDLLEQSEKIVSCGEFLKKARLGKGLSIEKAAGETKILASIIKNIENDAYEDLPPSIYLKGIIKKYANFLKLDTKQILTLYQESNGRKLVSGKDDLLPENRFFKKKSKSLLFITKFLPQISKWIFFSFIFLYFIYEASFFIMPAKIILYSPAEDFTTNEPELKIVGKVIRTKVFLVKDKEIYFKKNGEFEDKIILIPGLNNIEFKAKNILNHETSIWRQIIYMPNNVVSN